MANKKSTGGPNLAHQIKIIQKSPQKKPRPNNKAPLKNLKAPTFFLGIKTPQVSPHQEISNKKQKKIKDG